MINSFFFFKGLKNTYQSVKPNYFWGGKGGRKQSETLISTLSMVSIFLTTYVFMYYLVFKITFFKLVKNNENIQKKFREEQIPCCSLLVVLETLWFQQLKSQLWKHKIKTLINTEIGRWTLWILCITTNSVLNSWYILH